MCRARIKGALVGVESVTPEGLKAVYKELNSSGDDLVKKLRLFPEHGVQVLGSFIFGLSSDRTETFDTTVTVAQAAQIALAQFVTLTPFPGTVDFMRWEKSMENDPTRIAGFPLTRFWLIPRPVRPRLFIPHPEMSSEEIRQNTQVVWDRFYSLKKIWQRSRCTPTLRSRLAFIMISKLYRQMYANTGLATDSARIGRAAQWASWVAKPLQRFFQSEPMPELQVPGPSSSLR